MTNGNKFTSSFDEINIPFDEYITNLEAEGFFTEEELGEESIDEDIEEEAREQKEEYISSRGSELAANLSTMFDIEAGSSGQDYFEGRFISEECSCRPGEACRWEPSSTYYSLLGEKITHEISSVLGLRMWETWRLPCNSISEESIRVRYQGGQGTFDLWIYPESLLRLENDKISGVCKNDNVWLYRGECGPTFSRLWVGKLTETSNFQIIRYECTGYGVIATSQFTDKIQWNGESYWIYSRLVEWQFEEREVLQTEAAVAFWTSRHEEDEFVDEARNFFTDLHNSSGRGFLRYIF